MKLYNLFGSIGGIVCIIYVEFDNNKKWGFDNNKKWVFVLNLNWIFMLNLNL